jgi:hypothetical protein
LEEKEHIKEAFLEGVCKIIIGTATIREGIDLQRKGTVLYNCYPDWNPTDLKQLEGRIWRQGNEFGYVRVVMPLVQDSMDVFVFQKLEEKTSRINDLWYKGGSSNVLDVESLDPEEVKFALYTNIEALTSILLTRESKEAQRKRSLLLTQIDTLGRLDFKVRRYFQYQQKCLTRLKELITAFTKFFIVEQGKFLDKENHLRFTLSKKKEILEKATLLIQEANAFLSAADQPDKELLRLGRTFYAIAEQMESKDNREDVFGEFRALVSEIRKAEEGILKQKGFSLQDDLNTVIASLRTDVEKTEKEIILITSPENIQKTYLQIKEKKEKMQVSGESAAQRAREFASLNYLLDYKTGQHEESCELPHKNKQTANRPADSSQREREKKIRLAKAKAKALLLKWKFQ